MVVVADVGYELKLSCGMIVFLYPSTNILGSWLQVSPRGATSVHHAERTRRWDVDAGLAGRTYPPPALE